VRVLDTELKRLYDAVLTAPHDDAPRFAMADHLDQIGDPWGAFIRAQLAVTRALRTGTQEVAHFKSEAQRLRQRNANGKAWKNGIDVLAEHSEFNRGFVEHVMIGAQRYLEHVDELFQRAPIRFLILVDVDDRLAAVLEDHHLEQVVFLSICNQSSKQRIGDAGLAAIAASPHLGHLKELHVSQQDIGMPGLEALCASQRLPSLIYVEFVGNRVPEPAEEFSEDWASGRIVAESIRLPPIGKELEAKYGSVPWLHGPSRLRNFPPKMEEL
jgi:uncharacterized protein (TIGR02996 family)